MLFYQSLSVFLKEYVTGVLLSNFWVRWCYKWYQSRYQLHGTKCYFEQSATQKWKSPIKSVRATFRIYRGHMLNPHLLDEALTREWAPLMRMSYHKRGKNVTPLSQESHIEYKTRDKIIYNDSYETTKLIITSLFWNPWLIIDYFNLCYSARGLAYS